MSNPWAQSFEELRSPYLQEKMAKKDYDGDGKIETGTQEYMGSRDKAIKKAMGKKVEGKKKVAEHHQKDANGNTIPHEDEGDGTPSSVEEMVDKKFGSDDKVNLKNAIKNIQSGNVKKIDKKVKKLSDEYTAEAKVDKLMSDKKVRQRRNEASGRKDKRFRSLSKDDVSKFNQERRREDHEERRGVKKVKGKMDIEDRMGKMRGVNWRKKFGINKEEVQVVSEADKKGKGSGSKDACYHKVKSRYSVWPSAYASGALVKCRKVGAKNWGNSSKKEEFDYYQMPMKSFGDMVGECWKTHKQVGTKMKGGKVVPNCVPKNESVEEAVKNPKLDIKQNVKNKIEINPEIKTEAAKAPVKK